MKQLYLVFLCEILVLCSSLKINDRGVCTVKFSVAKTRNKSYLATINKKCGKKKCTVKKNKIEKYTSITDRPVCCSGWEYKAESDICEPQCRTGCEQGLCIAPDQCQCTPPLYLDPIAKNACLETKCPNECINSICNNNTCVCLNEFIPYNATHCAPNCEPNFNLNRITLLCERCDCGNGHCDETNKCICDKGYESKEGNCKPICEPKCENAECVAPNACSCHDGYVESEEKWRCRAKCDNCEGICIAPNTCECSHGFVKVNNSCELSCDSLPEESCQDDQNYKIDSRFCYKSCVNDDCSQGDFTKSCAGFKVPKKSAMANSDGKQNLIRCSKYKYVLELDICKPICSLGCDGGRCVSPDECQCDPPLILNDMKNKCIEPACQPQCVNALCRNTNECHCNPDHIPYNSTLCVPNCPDGYKINEETLVACLPKCSKPCTNGVCSAPEQCSCFEGYELSLNDTYKCVHICNPKCVNADCVGHNKCECHDGYENVDGICKAKCHSCEFGECISPNTCICKPGYERKSNSCVPQCQTECSHGFCHEPNKCICDPGYLFDEASKNCRPACNTECVNSTCVAPNDCSCWVGYALTNKAGVCKAKCDNCSNGTCTGPNVCICDKGYEKVDSICKPVCKEICTDGYCISPDVCSCNDGFKLENNSCIPEELISCKSCGGKCSEDSCYCLDRRPCYLEPEMPAEVQSPKMAGLELTWIAGGSVGLLLLILIIAVTGRLWGRRKKYQAKTGDNKNQYGSVVYTVPDTLVRQNEFQTEPLADEERSFIESLNRNCENEFPERRTPLLNHKTYVE